MNVQASVGELRAAGVSPLRLAVAAHEIGHGLAWRAAGFAAGPAQIKSGRTRDVVSASCAHGAGGRVRDYNVHGFLVGLVAGAVAQRRFAAEYLDGQRTDEGGQDDRREFARMERGWRTGLTWRVAWRDAVLLLWRQSRELDELTVRLARTGRVAL